MKDGKRCSGSIPYGYNRVPSDKQALVVDPVAAEVVKRIFLLANEGKSTRAIAEKLTEEKVLIPSAYAKEYHPEQYNGQKYSNPNLWGMSTVRGILERQEYLGHTVLRKTVGTNFKLHKRKSTAQDEQYLFQNTHEPIISQELWDSVHRRRKRVQRASAWGSHTNRLSGYLYCADCGRRLTLQTHYSKRDGSVQYSYRCGGYASRVNSCTAHSISADNVEALVLSSVRRFSRFVLQDENAFAAELQSLWILWIVRLLALPVIALLYAAGFVLNLLYGICGSIGMILAGLGGFAAFLALLDGSYAQAAASALVALLLCPFAAPMLLSLAGSALIVAASAIFAWLF